MTFFSLSVFHNFYCNFQPHEVPEKWTKTTTPGPRNATKNTEDDINPQTSEKNKKTNKKPSLKIKSREKLDTTLLRLLARLPNSKEPLDASHLLDGKRLRKTGKRS